MLLSKYDITLGIGVLLIIIGLLYLIKLRKVQKDWVSTIARVSGYHKDSRGFSIYPVYEFFDQQDNLIKAVTTFSIFSFRKKKVKIRYNPSNPYNLVPSHWMISISPYVVIFMGFCFLFYSIL